MMKRILLLALFSFALSSSGLWAQHKAAPDANSQDKRNYPVHVSDKLNNSEIVKKLIEKNKNNPVARKSMLVVDTVGQEKQFFVYNFEQSTANNLVFDSKNFRLIKKGNLTQIWFEIAEIDNGHLNDAVADSMFKSLEESSNQYSFDPSMGIIELSNEYLGDPPNYDGDGLVDFLITDIQDGWDPVEGGGYTAGFFFSVDQSSGDNSNERDVLYIDSYPGIFSNGEADPERSLSTLAHEYQHLIHYNYNSGLTDEITFINEAQSNFASLLSGYFPYNGYGQYLAETNVPLFGWRNDENVFADYARAASFASYMWDQLGFENSGSLTQNPLSGREGIESTFISLGAPFTFEEFLVNWGIANLLNDKELNTFHGYGHPYMSNLRVGVDFENPNISSRNITVKSGGIDYVGFSQSKNLEIKVSASNTQNGRIRVITIDQEGAVETHSLNSGETFTTPDEELFDKVYVMLVNTETSGDTNLNFSLNTSGEQSYNLTAFGTYSQTPKFYWAVPYENASGVGRLGFSNKYTIQLDALIHSLELFIVSGQDTEGAQIGVKGEGTLRIAVYSDNGGSPDQELAADSIAFNELGTQWQTFNVTHWGLEVEQGDVIHVVYELIVPTVDPDVNSVPLRLDDGNGTQNVTNIITAPDEFTVMFSDEDTEGQHGVWNNLVLAEEIVVSTEENRSTQPEVFELSQNYPNPFNPSTNINFNIPVSADVELTIYNALGQKVATLVNSTMPAGPHTVSWDANNMASGLYIYKIKAGDFVKTKKMVLMK